MASYFYAMMRILRLEKALQATIHQQPFRDLKLNARQKACVRDIKDDNLFKAMYRLLRAVFPAIRLLRYCDSSKPVMDKVYYLVKRTTAAIEKSIEALNDEKLFVVDKNMGELDAETEQVFGSDTDDETDSPSSLSATATTMATTTRVAATTTIVIGKYLCVDYYFL